MPTTLSAAEVALRLGLAVLASVTIGLNRGMHGRAAGLRTMIMVGVAAALAMLLANYIANSEREIATTGAMRMDPLRLPLGILTGIGFLGAGAIIRRGDLVRGVTTAATIWYVTVMGICFGAGKVGIGLVAWGIAVVALWLLPYVEEYLNQERSGSISVTTRPEGITEQELQQALAAAGLRVQTLAITQDVPEKLKTIRCDIQYHAAQTFNLPPQLVSELSHRPGIVAVKWG